MVFIKLRNFIKNKDEPRDILRFRKIVWQFNQDEKSSNLSFKVTQLLTKKKKYILMPISLPILESAVDTMITDEAVMQIQTIPLPAHTIASTIQDVWRDIDYQLEKYFTNTKLKYKILEYTNRWKYKYHQKRSNNTRGGKIFSVFLLLWNAGRTTREDEFWF